MPTITQEHTQAFAHCRDSLCPGNEQEPVAAVRERSDTTFKETGGDGSVPGIERTIFRFMFAELGDMPCPHCGEDREVSDQQRPTYPVMVSQFNANSVDPRFLLKLKRDGLVTAPGGGEGGDATGAQRDELEQLRREVAEMRGFISGQNATTRPPDGPADTEAPVRRRGRAKPAAAEGDEA